MSSSLVLPLSVGALNAIRFLLYLLIINPLLSQANQSLTAVYLRYLLARDGGFVVNANRSARGLQIWFPEWQNYASIRKISLFFVLNLLFSMVSRALELTAEYGFGSTMTFSSQPKMMLAYGTNVNLDAGPAGFQMEPERENLTLFYGNCSSRNATHYLYRVPVLMGKHVSCPAQNQEHSILVPLNQCFAGRSPSGSVCEKTIEDVPSLISFDPHRLGRLRYHNTAGPSILRISKTVILKDADDNQSRLYGWFEGDIYFNSTLNFSREDGISVSRVISRGDKYQFRMYNFEQYSEKGKNVSLLERRDLGTLELITPIGIMLFGVRDRAHSKTGSAQLSKVVDSGFEEYAAGLREKWAWTGQMLTTISPYHRMVIGQLLSSSWGHEKQFRPSRRDFEQYFADEQALISWANAGFRPSLLGRSNSHTTEISVIVTEKSGIRGTVEPIGYISIIIVSFIALIGNAMVLLSYVIGNQRIDVTIGSLWDRLRNETARYDDWQYSATAARAFLFGCYLKHDDVRIGPVPGNKESLLMPALSDSDYE